MIAHVTVSTAKLQESVDFYQWLLDLPIARSIEMPNVKIVFLGENETKLELIEALDAEPVDAKGLTVGFQVDNLDEKLALLDSRQIGHTDVISPNPGTRFAMFSDLNGCAIQLIEQ